VMRRPDLAFDNGFGGFSEDGREYVIHLEPGQSTPAPWCTCSRTGVRLVVSESGAGFTWAGNSGENRLTPWTNDPVADPPGEVLYLRDEETASDLDPDAEAGGDGRPPARSAMEAGYTEWRRTSHGFEQQLLIFVPPGDPVKLVRLRLQNLDCRPRPRDGHLLRGVGARSAAQRLASVRDL